MKPVSTLLWMASLVLAARNEPTTMTEKLAQFSGQGKYVTMFDPLLGFRTPSIFGATMIGSVCL